jgi:hypothetical protein
MFESWVKSLGLVGVVGMVFVGTAADGRTVNLTDGSGADIGWQATIPDVGDANSIQLSFVRSANGVHYINKSATVTSNDSALVIEFVRTSATAPTLAIGTESITNSSGADWTGFRTFVSTATAAGGTGAGFQLSADDGFNVNPFTTMSFTNNNTEMVATGGTVANGSSFTPGSASSGGLVILSANAADDRFLLKEIGLVGGNPGPGPGPVIPLPAAAWTGLSTLLGLGTLGAAKRVRRA